MKGVMAMCGGAVVLMLVAMILYDNRKGGRRGR